VTTGDINELLYAVGVILDPHAGDAIRKIAERLDVWVVPSPVNTAVVHELWAEEAGRSRGRKVTLWSNPFVPTTEEEWNDVLEIIVMHHGEYSHNPPVSIIEVFGGTPTPQAEKALRRYGYDQIENTSSGFCASKPKSWVGGTSQHPNHPTS